MNKYQIIKKIIDKYEGLYSDDKDDKGGETYRGISRKYHHQWKGWKIIDRFKDLPRDEFLYRLKTHQELERYVYEFYLDKYWDRLNLSMMPDIIAEELFEEAINQGTKVAAKHLQEALNLLNRNGVLFKDLVVDGIVGHNTLYAIKMVDPRRLLKVLNGLQFMTYYGIMKNNPLYEKYVGWFERV